VSRRQNGYVEVWIKELPGDDVTRAVNSDSTSKLLIDRAVKKMMANYKLPFAAVRDGIDHDTYVTFVMAEEAANIGDITPTSRILYQIDCPHRMIRDLSVYMVRGGKTISYDQPLEWQHVAP
jgi:hypothetical protein